MPNPNLSVVKDELITCLKMLIFTIELVHEFVLDEMFDSDRLIDTLNSVNDQLIELDFEYEVLHGNPDMHNELFENLD